MISFALSVCVSVCHLSVWMYFSMPFCISLSRNFTLFTIFNPYLCTQNCSTFTSKTASTQWLCTQDVSLSNTDNMSTHVNTDNNDAWHLLLVNAGHFKSILFHEHVTLTLNLYFVNKLHYSSPILSNEIRMCKMSECMFCEHGTILKRWKYVSVIVFKITIDLSKKWCWMTQFSNTLAKLCTMSSIAYEK